VSLTLLSRFGLLIPVFRNWEYVHLFGADSLAIRPDGLPLPPAGLRIRSAGTANTGLFIEGGRLAEEYIRSALTRVDAPLDSFKAILGFGCGCVLRRWRNLEAPVCGSDLSVPAIEWCRISLPFAEVTLNALEPSLPYPKESFDLV
jgi:hypothetical protein